MSALRALIVSSVLLLGACAPGKPVVEVWKSESCGCCKDWVRHLEDNGFEVRASNVEEPASYRARLGMPDHLGSCHSAKVAGYALEGHVPAREIRRLLMERPDAIGLTVPAMPVGSPGMDGPEYGGRKDRYDVLLVVRGAKPRVYQSYH